MRAYALLLTVLGLTLLLVADPASADTAPIWGTPMLGSRRLPDRLGSVDADRVAAARAGQVPRITGHEGPVTRA
jgi:hypothetical protein